MAYDLTRATDRALRHVEVSFRTDCSADAFARALATGRPDPATRRALTLFLAENDEELMVELVAEGATSFAILAGLACDLLAPGHPARLFLDRPPA